MAFASALRSSAAMTRAGTGYVVGALHRRWSRCEEADGFLALAMAAGDLSAPDTAFPDSWEGATTTGVAVAEMDAWTAGRTGTGSLEESGFQVGGGTVEVYDDCSACIDQGDPFPATLGRFALGCVSCELALCADVEEVALSEARARRFVNMAGAVLVSLLPPSSGVCA